MLGIVIACMVCTIAMVAWLWMRHYTYTHTQNSLSLLGLQATAPLEKVLPHVYIISKWRNHKNVYLPLRDALVHNAEGAVVATTRWVATDADDFASAKLMRSALHPQLQEYLQLKDIGGMFTAETADSADSELKHLLADADTTIRLWCHIQSRPHVGRVLVLYDHAVNQQTLGSDWYSHWIEKLARLPAHCAMACMMLNEPNAFPGACYVTSAFGITYVLESVKPFQQRHCTYTYALAGASRMYQNGIREIRSG